LLRSGEPPRRHARYTPPNSNPVDFDLFYAAANTWVKHKTICGGLSLAKSVAKSIATQNGQCKVKDVTERQAG